MNEQMDKLTGLRERVEKLEGRVNAIWEDWRRSQGCDASMRNQTRDSNVIVGNKEWEEYGPELAGDG